MMEDDGLIDSMIPEIVETSGSADGTVEVKFSAASRRRRPPCGSQ